MSGLNYSKWDNLELSDDEDFECHPNVDKKSFIKWKQESIHQERAQRNHKIQQLEQRIQSNKRVMPMIEQAIESVKTAPEDKLEDFLDTLQEKVLEDNEKLQRKVAKSSSGTDKNVYNNAETPEDIFLSFLSFVQADIHRDSMELTKFNLQAKMVEELGKVKTHDEQCRTELEKEKKIKNSKLTSENLYKPGFDKTVILLDFAILFY
jgi:cell division cycle protein 37